MKKSLILFSVAALALVSCAKVQDVYAPESHEIGFTALSQPATRAAIDAFTSEDIEVAAYDATNDRDFFAGTTFKKGYVNGADASGSYWGGDPARYWPLSAAYINFLAYANVQGSAAFNPTSDYASAAVITQTDNSSAQKDLMFARGNAEVTQSGNVLNFPDKVDMAFTHAQSLIVFRVKAADTPSTAITVTKIVLNNAFYSGTFNITLTNFDATSSQSVDGVWASAGDKKNLDPVPGSNTGVALSSSDFSERGKVLVVPNPASTVAPPAIDPSFDSFTIHYTLDSKAYTYTYTPTVPTGRILAKATKYVYDITFRVHEIYVNPSVTAWTDGGTGALTIY